MSRLKFVRAGRRPEIERAPDVRMNGGVLLPGADPLALIVRELHRLGFRVNEQRYPHFRVGMWSWGDAAMCYFTDGSTTVNCVAAELAAVLAGTEGSDDEVVAQTIVLGLALDLQRRYEDGVAALKNESDMFELATNRR